MTEVVVLAARRTPIAKFLGSFSSLTPADLGVAVVQPLLEQVGVEPEQVVELVFGCGRQAGSGPNLARQVAVRSGLPISSTAYTVNMACGSGLLAILQAADSLRRGDSDLVVAGGAESMTRLPYFLERARTGYRLGHGELVDGMYRDGFMCPLANQLMGDTAENLADEFSIDRDEQDAYAVETQRRCEHARAEGRFQSEIVPVEVKSRKKTVVIDGDEHPRAGVTQEDMAKLPPVFRDGGTVHAGNSSGITDGAAALLLTTREVASRLGIEPLATLGASARAGVEPSRMGMGPVPAIHRLLEKTGHGLDDFDLVELNEAFAAQVLACDRELRFDRERLNVNGGAIALGHPIGATGSRIVVTLLHEMLRRDAARGLATLCISGGMGIALELNRGRG